MVAPAHHPLSHSTGVDVRLWTSSPPYDAFGELGKVVVKPANGTILLAAISFEIRAIQADIRPLLRKAKKARRERPQVRSPTT